MMETPSWTISATATASSTTVEVDIAVTGSMGALSVTLVTPPTWITAPALSINGSGHWSLNLNNAPCGLQTLTLQLSDGSHMQSQTFSFTVVDTDGLAITATPNSLTTLPGGHATTDVSFTANACGSGELERGFTASAGITVTYAGDVATVAADTSVGPGTYQVVLTGAQGGAAGSRTITLVITQHVDIDFVDTLGSPLVAGSGHYMRAVIGETLHNLVFLPTGTSRFSADGVTAPYTAWLLTYGVGLGIAVEMGVVGLTSPHATISVPEREGRHTRHQVYQNVSGNHTVGRSGVVFDAPGTRSETCYIGPAGVTNTNCTFAPEHVHGETAVDGTLEYLHWDGYGTATLSNFQHSQSIREAAHISDQFDPSFANVTAQSIAFTAPNTQTKWLWATWPNDGSINLNTHASGTSDGSYAVPALTGLRYGMAARYVDGANSATGPYSIAFANDVQGSVNLTPPPTPTLLSPLNGSSGDTNAQPFSWSSQPDAVYMLGLFIGNDSYHCYIVTGDTSVSEAFHRCDFGCSFAYTAQVTTLAPFASVDAYASDARGGLLNYGRVNLPPNQTVPTRGPVSDGSISASPRIRFNAGPLDDDCF